VKQYISDSLFDDYFINTKYLYLKEFGTIPCIYYLGKLEGKLVAAFLDADDAGHVLDVFQRSYFDWEKNKSAFSTTIYMLKGQVIVELFHNHLHIYYQRKAETTITMLVNQLLQFKEEVKIGEFNINVISKTSGGMELKQLSILPTELDIDLYYNDDFKAVDHIIRGRLSKEKDKGIILLHGLPGTGKTTYLRHLVGTLQKKVLFVSPTVAGDLMDPDFIDLLMDNPNAVLIIEDAENIVLDRRYNSRSGVSNLLNISDGLLSDCLHLQLICTFNSAISTIDAALLRQGRLIARYEFGRLTVDKARKLSDRLGIDQDINTAKTLAEITNPGGFKDDAPKTELIGFRSAFAKN
jgi:hypothetical protein